MIGSTTTYDLVVTRVFDAPLEQAWSESEFVKQWWGPICFTCPLANMDFREGGTLLICMCAPKEFGSTTDQVVELSKAGLEQCLDKMAAIFAKA
jgi:uncharacterized protein YndB with AHSA1/START domain